MPQGTGVIGHKNTAHRPLHRALAEGSARVYWAVEVASVLVEGRSSDGGGLSLAAGSVEVDASEEAFRGVTCMR